MNEPLDMDGSALFGIMDDLAFREAAIRIFHYQAEHCTVYRNYIRHIGVDPSAIETIEQIPYLPIAFFKHFRVVSGSAPSDCVFRSSKTTGQAPSEHHVTDLSLYDHSIDKGFELFFGHPRQFAILALLPSYLEREDASLVYMAKRLMHHSGHPLNGFFLNDHDRLLASIERLSDASQRFILLGVTYALLDLGSKAELHFGSNIVMETGGMKGRRKEIIREELHEELCMRFGVQSIHSEYGMTELLSQAWSHGSGIYHTPPWMRVITSEINDPFQLLPHGEVGILNVIDLANLNSCSFIATQDLGKVFQDGSFEVLGRVDHSEIRGCNLMVI